MELKLFRALRSRNLRLYFFGQGISLIGTWISTIATSWLIYRLTDSELMLGLSTFCSQFPSALGSPFAGVFVDQYDRRRMLMVTQALSLVQSAMLAVLTLRGTITVEQILALNVFQALVNAFDMPARQSMLSEIVEERSDLPNAIALGSAMFHGARLIGPAIAGILIAAVGEGYCFTIDAFSYGAVLISLFVLQPNVLVQESFDRSWKNALLDGLRYVATHHVLRRILTLVAVFAFFGTSQITLLPVFARDVFHGGPELYGMLASASGLGAFLGALYLAGRSHGNETGKIVRKLRIVFGISLVLLSYAPTPALAAVCLFVVGFSMVVVFAGSNTVLQMVVDDSKRARVLSLYGAAFFGLMPLGGLFAGLIAGMIGAPLTVLLSGSMCTAVAWRTRKRPHFPATS